MKHRIGKEPKGGSKKRKEVWNDNALSSMFANQQAASEQTNQEKNTMHSFRKEKKLGWRTQTQSVKVEPVRRSEKDTHDLEARRPVDETVPKHSVDPKCFPKHFISDDVCEMSGHDVLAPQQFQDSITTAPMTTQAVSTHKKHKERQVQVKGVKTSAFKITWKTNRPWLDLCSTQFV
jgi:hypothetical protein